MMKISNLASGLVIIGLGLAGTASAQTIERGVHKITIDNSTSPAAATYDGKDRNREVRYTNSATNTDLGAREYRETTFEDDFKCYEFYCDLDNRYAEDTSGNEVIAHHGTLVHLNAGERNSKTREMWTYEGYTIIDESHDSTARYAAGNIANNKAGFTFYTVDDDTTFAVGNISDLNEDQTRLNTPYRDFSAGGTDARVYAGDNTVTYRRLYYDDGRYLFDDADLAARTKNNEVTATRKIDSGYWGVTSYVTTISAPIGQDGNSVALHGDPTEPTANKRVVADLNSTGTYGDLTFDDIGRSGDDPAKVNGYVTQGGATLTFVDTDEGTAPVQSVTFSNGSTLAAVNRTGADQPQSLEVIAAGNGFTGDNVATFTPAEDGAGRTPTVTYTNYAKGVSIEAGDEGVYRQGVRADVAYVFVDANLREDLLTSTGDAYVEVLNQSADADVISHPISPTTTEIDLNALDAVEVTLYADGSLPAVAFGPAMPMGGLIGVLLDQDFVGNTIANNGFAQAILNNGFVQGGLAAAAPVTDQVPGGVPGQ